MLESYKLKSQEEIDAIVADSKVKLEAELAEKEDQHKTEIVEIQERNEE